MDLVTLHIMIYGKEIDIQVKLSDQGMYDQMLRDKTVANIGGCIIDIEDWSIVALHINGWSWSDTPVIKSPAPSPEVS